MERRGRLTGPMAGRRVVHHVVAPLGSLDALFETSGGPASDDLVQFRLAAVASAVTPCLRCALLPASSSSLSAWPQSLCVSSARALSRARSATVLRTKPRGSTPCAPGHRCRCRPARRSSRAAGTWHGGARPRTTWPRLPTTLPKPRDPPHECLPTCSPANRMAFCGVRGADAGGLFTHGR